MSREPAFPAPADPGLQPERTALAWTRTSCSLLVVGLLGVRFSGLLGGTLLLVAAVAGTAMVLLSLATRRRAQRLGSALTGPRGTPPPALQVAALAAAVAVLGAVCAVVVALA